MKKVMIFGAADLGMYALCKLRKFCEILYFVDNNPRLHGTKIQGITVISAERMMEIYNEDIYIIVCSYRSLEIGAQLMGLGVEGYYVMTDGFLYYNSRTESAIPAEICRQPYYRKEKGEKTILFVQSSVCIRTHKLASVMHESGYRVFLLYTFLPPEGSNAEFIDAYDGIYTFFTHDALVDFVEKSDFDIIHSSNEPDLLTNLLFLTSKHVVFDTHDMMSIRRHENIYNLTCEYMASVASDGNMYTQESIIDMARKKYGLEGKELFVIENTVFDECDMPRREKLSSIDGEIHCVYEGGIVGYDVPHHLLQHRFFENMWKKILDCGIHIHYYSADVGCYPEIEGNKYLHYEGNLGTKKLIPEMAKYDCGLAMFNVTDLNRLYLSSTTSNKIYEYISAGLPVLVADVPSHVAFVEKYNVGKRLDFEKDVREQIVNVCKIEIEEKFLTKNKLTMMSRSSELIGFYERVMKRKIIRKM